LAQAYFCGVEIGERLSHLLSLIKLRDGKKLKGYVAQIADDHCVVVDVKTSAPTSVPSPKVKLVKRNNISTSAQIDIAVIIAVVVIALIFGRLA